MPKSGGAPQAPPGRIDEESRASAFSGGWTREQPVYRQARKVALWHRLQAHRLQRRDRTSNRRGCARASRSGGRNGAAAGRVYRASADFLSLQSGSRAARPSAAKVSDFADASSDGPALHDLLPVGCSTEPTKPAQTPGRIVEIERMQLADIVHHQRSCAAHLHRRPLRSAGEVQLDTRGREARDRKFGTDGQRFPREPARHRMMRPATPEHFKELAACSARRALRRV